MFDEHKSAELVGTIQSILVYSQLPRSIKQRPAFLFQHVCAGFQLDAVKEPWEDRVGPD